MSKQYKTCCHCGKTKPAKPEYFHFKNIEEQTFHDECKLCRSNKEQESIDRREDQYLANRQQLLEQERLKLAQDKWLLVKAGLWEMGLDVLAKHVALDMPTGSSIPHPAEMVEAYCTVLGGPMGIATQLANIFYDPETKQSDRIRVMELIHRMITKNAEMGGAQKSYEQMDQKDLEKEAEHWTKLANAQQDREVA